MACGSNDTLSPSSAALLRLVATPVLAEEIATKLGQPLYKVRSGLREMVNKGLIMAEGDTYVITAKGKAQL